MNNTKTSFGWLLKMAWRDGKASSRKLVLFMASIVLGIAAVVSIQSFGKNLRENIAQQSKAMMGADFKIDMEEEPSPEVTAIIDSLGGAQAREISFNSMAAFPEKNSTRLVQVRGITGDFPLYGKMETTPPGAATNFEEKDGVLLDATAMLQLGLEPGDQIKIGAVTLPILGALKSVPGSNAFFSSLAPPAVIPYRFIEETGLIQTGSRIDYEFYFKAPRTDLEYLDEELDDRLEAFDADLDTHTSTSERLGRRYENFGKFLNLVAFIALLLGCVGIASAINIYIKGKLKSVAVLKCLGATKRQSFMIYLLQIAGMGCLGGIIGTGAGLLLQQLFPLLLADLLPVDIQVNFDLQIILMGIMLGVLMSVLFALIPLISTLYVSPLETLRVQKSSNKRSGKAVVAVLAGIFLFILLFSYWLLKDWRYSFAFVVGIIVTFAILAGIAKLFMKVIRKNFPHSWGFPARQSLQNLFRPQNQTLTLVLAIGVGSFLISTLYFTRDMLLAQASLDSQSGSPNVILLDVQTGQEKEVAQTIQQSGSKLLNDIPIVTMRVQSIKGQSVNELRQDTLSNINEWVLNHEFRVTYRDSLNNSEVLSAGKWIAQVESLEIIPISISDNFAEDAQVKVGDRLAFNVQGVIMETEVGSIRTVDWSQMQPNFSIVFPRGVLESAPQFRVITTKVASEAASAALQQQLVKLFPNISIIDLRQVLSVLEDILNKIAWLINFMAFFSILTGIIVLLGAVRTSKFQRIKESVLLRTMGARSHQILKILALEYFYLGMLGSLAGIILSLLGSLLLAWLLFEATFIPSLFPFLVLFPGITLLVMIIGLTNSVSVVKSPPLEVLRKQN